MRNLAEREEQTIKIRFSADETGWATVIVEPGMKARIANVPLSNGLNIDDTVILGAPDSRGLRPILEVLEHVFECKTFVRMIAEKVPAAARILSACGCKCEGAASGILVVAHQEVIQVIDVLNAAGIECSALHGV